MCLPRAESHNRLAEHDEAVELLRRCGVVVMHFREASQSALLAAVYFFPKPVIATDVGVPPECVEPGVTGWPVPAEDSRTLAGALQEALVGTGRMAARGHAE